AMLAGVLTAVQVRASQAEVARSEAAALAAAEDRAREHAEGAAARAAEQEATDVALITDWAAATTDAQALLVEADAVLVGSNGRVADDTVRLRLRQAIDTVRTLVEDEGREPSAGVLDALSQAVDAMVAASTT